MAPLFLREVGKNIRADAAKEISNSVVKYVKKTLKKTVRSEKTAASSPENSKDVSNIDYNVMSDREPDETSREANDEQLVKSIRAIFKTPRHNLTWDDLIGLKKVKEDIEIAVELPLRQPQLFRNRKPCQFLLLYGPPGTGKTQVARILAATTNRSLGIVSASDVISKWVGDSARLVRLLFQYAREIKPAIIFFDEVDAVCGQRTTDTGRSHADLQSELLAQMDGARADNDGIFFIGATNLRDKLDSAFLSRFEEQIHVPLPGPNSRIKILMQEIGDIGIELPGSAYLTRQAQENQVLEYLRWLEDKTVGFSGRDLKNLVQEALREHLRRVMRAESFQIVRMRDGTIQYAPSSQKGRSLTTWTEVPDGMIEEGKLLWQDITGALKTIEPSTRAADPSATVVDSNARCIPRIYTAQLGITDTRYGKPPPQLDNTSAATNTQFSSSSTHLRPGERRPELLPYNFMRRRR